MRFAWRPFQLKRPTTRRLGVVLVWFGWEVFGVGASLAPCLVLPRETHVYTTHLLTVMGAVETCAKVAIPRFRSLLRLLGRQQAGQFTSRERPSIIETHRGRKQTDISMLARLKSRYYGAGEAPLSEEEAEAKLREAVAADVTPETASFVTSDCLQRYLRARNWDVDKARRMLQATLIWRSSYRPDTLPVRELALLRSESATGKMYVLERADLAGRAIIVMRPGLENSRDSRGKIANLVYTLERASCLARDQFLVIVDYMLGEVSAATLPSLSVSRDTANILQGHYPERLACMVLVNAPKIFHAMFKVLAPLVDVQTKQKIHFVQKCEEVVEVDGVDRDALPTEYGGKLEGSFDVDRYFEAEGAAGS